MNPEKDNLSPEDKFLIGELNTPESNSGTKETKTPEALEKKENIKPQENSTPIEKHKLTENSKPIEPTPSETTTINQNKSKETAVEEKTDNPNHGSLKNESGEKKETSPEKIIQETKEQIKSYLQGDYTHVLQIIKSMQGSSEFYLTDNKEYTIGSHKNFNDIIFRDPTVSHKHAILILQNGVVFIKDNNSSNGIYVKGKKISQETQIEWSDVITIGNTSFIVISKNTNIETIITSNELDPSMFLIETQEQQKKRYEKISQEETNKKSALVHKKIIEKNVLKMVFFLSIMLFIFTFYAHNIWKLFHIEVLTEEEELVDFKKHLDKLFYPYPQTSYSFNKITKECLITGHVLKASEKTDLVTNVINSGIIKKVESSKLVVDEIILDTFNEMINKNSSWRTVYLECPSPGKFILQGKVKTQATLDKIHEYLEVNFPFNSLLEINVLIENDVLQNIMYALRKSGFLDVTVNIQDQAAHFYGMIPRTNEKEFMELINQIKEKYKLNFIYNYVICTNTDNLLIDISHRYRIHGYTCDSLGNRSIVINEHLYKIGDFIDNLEIIKIEKHHIILRFQNNSYVIYF